MNYYIIAKTWDDSYKKFIRFTLHKMLIRLDMQHAQKGLNSGQDLTDREHIRRVRTHSPNVPVLCFVFSLMMVQRNRNMSPNF